MHTNKALVAILGFKSVFLFSPHNYTDSLSTTTADMIHFSAV